MSKNFSKTNWLNTETNLNGYFEPELRCQLWRQFPIIHGDLKYGLGHFMEPATLAACHVAYNGRHSAVGLPELGAFGDG
jgi:hypothetical protein